MTRHGFKDWIQTTYIAVICRETARAWLHDLGFSQKKSSQGGIL